MSLLSKFEEKMDKPQIRTRDTSTETAVRYVAKAQRQARVQRIHDRAIVPTDRKVDKVRKTREPVSPPIGRRLEAPSKHHERALAEATSEEERITLLGLFAKWASMREEHISSIKDANTVITGAVGGSAQGILKFVTSSKIVNPRKEMDAKFTRLYHEYVVPRADPGIWVIEDTITPIKASLDARACPGCGGDSFSKRDADPTSTCTTCGTCVTLSTDDVPRDGGFVDMEGLSLVRKAMPYQRTTHFKERIDRLEGSEQKNIPAAIIEKILQALKTRKIDPIQNPTLISYPLVRSILKEIRHSSFYANITSIINSITGRQCVERFTDDERAILAGLFEQCQEPFEKFKSNRSNFLSYSYTLSKLCIMIGIDRFIPFLSEFENPANLRSSEKTWKQICDYNANVLKLPYWVFVPS